MLSDACMPCAWCTVDWIDLHWIAFNCTAGFQIHGGSGLLLAGRIVDLIALTLDCIYTGLHLHWIALICTYIGLHCRLLDPWVERIASSAIGQRSSCSPAAVEAAQCRLGRPPGHFSQNTQRLKRATKCWKIFQI